MYTFGTLVIVVICDRIALSGFVVMPFPHFLRVSAKHYFIRREFSEGIINNPISDQFKMKGKSGAVFNCLLIFSEYHNLLPNHTTRPF